jgi:RND family efflux transporter MFP subunit
LLPFVFSLLLFVCVAPVAPVAAVELDGFAEPYRKVDVAAHETGIITAINARVGDTVNKGDVTATLDDDVHKLLVESARVKMEARGKIESARAELELRKSRLSKLKTMLARGHGREEEVDRAQADVDIAAAQLIDTEDGLLIHKLDHRRLSVELERRKIYAPLSGVVSRNLKEEGEFVAPNDPDVLTIVQLDPLLAKFSLRRSHAESIHHGDSVKVTFPNFTDPVDGVVEEVSPVIDAESGTIRVKVRIENPNHIYQSGQRCTLLLPERDFPEPTRSRRDSKASLRTTAVDASPYRRVQEGR